MFYYLDKEKLKNNKVFVMAITDDRNEELGNMYFEYIGDNLPQYPIYKNNELREANDLEKISLGYIKLEDWQYIDGDTIKNKPPIPAGMVKPVWDEKNNVWEESATEEEIAEYKKKLAEEEYRNNLPRTVSDMDNRLYMTQDMLDMLMFELTSVQTFVLKTMTIEKQEEYVTTQAFYYYDRIIQKEKREGLQSAMNYYNLVASKFPQYKEDIDFLLIENDKEYIKG